MNFETTERTMRNLGVERICGSVISIRKNYKTEWEKVKDWNEQALILKEKYGSESWTIKKAKSQRNDAFELWCWRRLL